jgi:serine/threonine-protein kinase
MTDRLDQVQRAFTSYVIERELGSGGMATVYLARDQKHDRKVAIKILHAELAAVLGAERFLQEIRVTANLQHPHILGLIDSGIIGEGELRGRPYYVMPFVKGESLRQRLDKEQQLPVSDAVRIATEVASALDYAHRQGVIHRDIKPENILLHDGSAIVADFGIALAVTEAGGGRMTQTGLSLGTPSYMSPEQAMGERAITARSDIYSLGAVTYEMLSGEPPFTGPTVQAIVARVMTEEPRSLSGQRRSVPPHVDAAVSRALEKVPADRFASAHEFSEALNNPAFAGPSSATGRKRQLDNRSKPLLYGITALAVVLGIAAVWGWMRPTPAKQPVRYTLAFDSEESIDHGGSFWGRIALSPDGTHLAYVGVPRGTLWIRPRNQLHATAVAGTEGANTPFFSPDGQQVGFVSAQRVVRFVPVKGGAPTAITDSLIGVAGASWGRDGFIYADGFGAASLVRVEAKPGGVPKAFTTLDTASGETDHIWPDVLPNGKGVIFTVYGLRNDAQGNGPFAIAVADIPSGKHRILVPNSIFARYSPSGHLLYVTRDKILMIAPFDQNSMKLTGEPTPLVESVRLGSSGSADVAVSATGTLLYSTGAIIGKNELVWVSRDGRIQPIDSSWQGDFSYPSLSPNGETLAIRVTSSRTSDLWLKQLDRGPAIKFTLDGQGNTYPAWTPDGRSVTFTSSMQAGAAVLWTKRADGSSVPSLQLKEKRGVFGGSWSPDGKWLVYRTDRRGGAVDIMGIRPGIDGAPIPLIATKFTEFSPAISPDGRWLAYSSNESGRYEIYVVPFPNTSAAKWMVSTSRGTEPLWSHHGTELFYRDGRGNMIAVQVQTKPVFSAGRPTALFPATSFNEYEGGPQYAVSPDDQRFLMIRPVAGSAPDRLVVVENWFEELRSSPRSK